MEGERKQVYLRLLTPDGPLYEGYVFSVRLPGVLGSFTVLYRHAPLIAQMEPGTVHLRKAPSGEEATFDIAGGFVQVLKNEVIALVDKPQEA